MGVDVDDGGFIGLLGVMIVPINCLLCMNVKKVYAFIRHSAFDLSSGSAGVRARGTFWRCAQPLTA
jgi:hypothetical protein